MIKRVYFLAFLLTGAVGCGGDEGAENGGDPRSAFDPRGRGGGGRRGPAQASPEFQEVSVKASRVERQPISTYILSNTTLEPIRSVIMIARVSGLVTEILVEEGDRVREDQLLARLEDREIRNENEQAKIAVAQAEIQVRQAKVRAEQSQASYDRSITLKNQKLISQQDFDQAELNQRTDDLAFDVARQQHEAAKARLEAAALRLEYTEIRSSINGVITERLINVGDRLNANQEVVLIEDFTPMWARIFIPERELPLLRTGQAARVSLEAFPEQDFTGRIKMINPRVDAASGTVKVTLEMIDPSQRLRPGMFGVVRIPTSTRPDAVVLAKKAVLRERDENRVFVIKPDNTVEKRVIELGISEEDRVEVVRGLEPGETVVVVGQESLNDGYPVKVLAWEGTPGDIPSAAPAALPAAARVQGGPGDDRQASPPAAEEGRRRFGAGQGQRPEQRQGQGRRGQGRDREAFLERMLDSNPELKKEYDKRLAEDPELATDPDKRRVFLRELMSKLRSGRQ